MSQTLQKVDLKVTNVVNCQAKYSKNAKIFSSNQLCAGGEVDKDSCNGDSGSSLMKLNNRRDNTNGTESGDSLYYYSLIGIVSWGPEQCGTVNRPGVYTKVRAHIDWILKSLRKFSANFLNYSRIYLRKFSFVKSIILQ